jgi:DNA polymerase-3 subunit alpha
MKKRRLSRVKLEVPSDSSFFHTHLHSQFSTIDGMTDVDELVRKAAKLGQPGIALTDHGNMAGTVRLYKTAKLYGMKPFPGIETYLINPDAEDPMDAKSERFHVGLLALDYKGYQGLVRLSSMAHTRPRFSRYPRLTLSDLAEFGKEFGKHVVLTTGCYFGLVQQQIDQDNIAAAERTIKSYASWFPHTFVELQNHGITHDEGSGIDDAMMVSILYKIADQQGLPVIATQDSHYLDQKNKIAHGLMKRMVYSGEEYSEFPGDSFHLASWDWVAEHYPPEIWEDVEDSCRWLIGHNRLSIPALDTFKAHVPQISTTPDSELRKLCRDMLAELLAELPDSKHKKYVGRLEEELRVIKAVGYANYFLMWLKFVLWCKKERICIEARGSANGSLVCYLLGITQIDPIYWNTMFERFMSEDRIKPPDVDMDVESDRRGECVEWWKRLGVDMNFDVVPIGNWSVLGSSGDGEDKGSVLVSYMSYLRRKADKMAYDYWLDHEEMVDGKKRIHFKVNQETGKPATRAYVTDYGKRIFGKRFGFVKTIEDVRRIDCPGIDAEKDYAGLRQLAAMASVYKSYGVHAAGLLMSSPDLSIEDNIPTMLVASSDTIVTQFDMNDVEEWGLMKNDILGQATLTVMRRCQEMINELYGDIEDPTDFSWIPYNDAAACKELRSGRVNNGIFHFEGYTKAKGGQEMGIKSTRDVVLATALYMPGATESGQKDHYLKHRRAGRYGRAQKYPHAAFEEVLSETHGAVIYQEQPIAILRLLGMSMANINLLFKVVKDSGKGAIERNAERITQLRKEFDYLCAKHDVQDIDRAWHLVTGFISYGFNRAHATGYGLRSYRCAYLKAHYPHEFMAALLEVWAGRSGKDRHGQTKEDYYAREARRLDIRLLPPHVNESGASWTLARDRHNQPRGIRKGLVSIGGVGPAAASEIARHRPYRSIADLCAKTGRPVTGKGEFEKTGALTGILEKLAQANALDDLKERNDAARTKR